MLLKAIFIFEFLARNAVKLANGYSPGNSPGWLAFKNEIYDAFDYLQRLINVQRCSVI